MSSILLFDPSIASPNIGDQIIIDSINKNLYELFPTHRVITSPTQEHIGRHAHRLNSEADFTFVGGTNLLSSQLGKYNQWKLYPWDALFLTKNILMGVGWWQYQSSPSFYSAMFYRRVLHDTMVHSVRDTYTKLKLQGIGISNVLNTGCPSTWSLTQKHLSGVPHYKSPSVIFTLTDYSKNPEIDAEFVRLLSSLYSRLYFWPQGSGDQEYFSTLGVTNVTILKPTLKAFDDLLSSDDELDYVGTRLHAAIRALQHQRRSICIAVDNRATEISRDTKLQIVDRGQMDTLSYMIKSAWETVFTVDFDAVSKWKEQFLS